MPTLPRLSVVDAKGAIDRREIACLEYVQALVDQHAKTESLNGFVSRCCKRRGNTMNRS
ncbi:hypothetical protein [Burkholderia cepacia]|uniref:hypothetical protein n=1 Tax=Burkholderia cepacia TaxID=292 RepID=UPI000ADB6640|nr:hypothetical protein [Burkholderia cepacia]